MKKQLFDRKLLESFLFSVWGTILSGFQFIVNKYIMMLAAVNPSLDMKTR